MKTSMLAARMHAYHQPLVLDEVPVPEIQSDEILVKVSAAGMCRTDVQLLDGYSENTRSRHFP